MGRHVRCAHLAFSVDNEIDGVHLFTLTDANMSSMGITEANGKRILMTQIDVLRTVSSPPPSPGSRLRRLVRHLFPFVAASYALSFFS